MGIRIPAGNIQSLIELTPNPRAGVGDTGTVRRAAVAPDREVTERRAPTPPSRAGSGAAPLAAVVERAQEGSASPPPDGNEEVAAGVQSAITRASDDGEREEAPAPSAADPTEQIAAHAGSVGSAGLFNGGFRFAAAETVRLEFELIAAQAAVERQLVREAGVHFVSDLDAVASARLEVAALRRQAQAIEREINRLRLARLAETTVRFARAAPPPPAPAQRDSAGTLPSHTPTVSSLSGAELLNLVA